MRNQLTWALVGIAALTLQVAAVGNAEAADGPVPPGCERPDLRPEAQARCDFIRHTPNICLRRELSPPTRLWCDQMRFAAEPHFAVIRLARNGTVRSIHVFETATGREVVTEYPYGQGFGAPTDDTREVRMKVEEIDGFVDGRPTPAAAERSTTAGYAAGVRVGWNDSSGIAPSQCLNYRLISIDGQTENSSYSSEESAASTAEQVNISATVKGVVDGFSGSDTFSLSDQWQSSTHSSNQYFNTSILYDLNVVVDSAEPLNELGQGAGDSFDTTCGSKYLDAVPAGMVSTLSVAYGSSSEATQTSVEDSFMASFGLDSINGAVKVASSSQDSSFYFVFNLAMYGGGPTATSALRNAFMKDNSAGEAYYVLCGQGNADACTTFTGNMGQAASQAVDGVEQQVTTLGSQANPDLSFLALFPAGVAGVTLNYEMNTIAIPTSSADDILTNYTTPLGRNAKLLNQLGTLYSRTYSLQQLFKTSNNFNPSTLLDIVGYLESLEGVYWKDRTTLLNNLKACLAATSNNVDTVGADLESTESETAFDWYAESGGNPNFFAQQNAIALQYTGLDGATPLDVVYIDMLPPFTAAGSNIPIAGEAGFVAFQDRLPPAGGAAAYVDILALEPDEPLSTDNVSSKIRKDPANPSPFTLYNINSFAGVVLDPVPNSFLTSNACTPTFESPCTIDYSFGATGLQDVQHVPIVALFGDNE